MEAVQCNQPATRLLADHLREWYYNSVLVFAAGNGASQCGVGGGKSVLLSPCITSVSSTVATVFISPLDIGTSGWRKEADWYTQNG